MHRTSAPPAFEPRLKRTLDVLHASDGNSYVLRGGVEAEFVVEQASAEERAVLDALVEGSGSLEQLRAGLARRGAPTDADTLRSTLEHLADLGLLEEPAGAAETVLGADAAERFDRQLAYFADVQPGRAAELQAKLGAARVLMVGVGGLGTWTASALTCAGIGHLTLLDDDAVELSNLNRQVIYRRSDVGRPKVEAAAEALAAFDPRLSITPVRERIAGVADAKRLVAGHDFVVELADWPPYDLDRWMEAACWPEGIPRITAALFPPRVRVGPTFVPGVTGCLQCQEEIARAEYPLYDELAALRQSRPTVAATLGPPAALIGGVIAMDVVHHLTGISPPATLDTALIIDTRDMSVERERLPRRPGCPRCGGARSAER